MNENEEEMWRDSEVEEDNAEGKHKISRQKGREKVLERYKAHRASLSLCYAAKGASFSVKTAKYRI